MLPASNRLTKEKDFEKVFKTGRSSYDRLTGIKAADNKTEVSRFGFLAGIKVSKKAVERNRLKRLAREAVAGILPAAKSGFDIAVIVLPAAKEAKGKELTDSIRGNLKKLRLL